MEIYPEQFPDESQPDPSQQAEDRVFDAIQGSDHPGFENHEGQPHPEAPEMDFTLWLPAWAASACRSRAASSHRRGASSTWKQ